MNTETKATTLAEWCEGINPWGCYKHSEVAREFAAATGKLAPWGSYKAKVANDTVGQFKGLTAPLELDDDELVADGWRIIEKVWDRYGKEGASPAERECISMMNGRGSIADACIRSLKRQGI